MSRVLARTVYLTDAAGEEHQLLAGSTVSGELEKLITNERAFVPLDPAAATAATSRPATSPARAVEEPQGEGYDAKTVKQLQELLGKRQLDAKGNKTELIARLVEADEAAKEAADKAAADAAGGSGGSGDAVDYEALGDDELLELAEQREVSIEGSAEEIIARLKAHDLEHGGAHQPDEEE